MFEMLYSEVKIRIKSTGSYYFNISKQGGKSKKKGSA